MKRIALLCLAALLSGGVSWADVPQQLSYEGRLFDASGNPVTGTVPIKFEIFDAATAGNSLWSDTLQSVAVLNGLYSVTLGTTAGDGFPATLFDGSVRYLEITVNGDTLAPRQPIGSVAYAITAGNAQSVSVPGASGAAPVVTIDQNGISINGTPVIDANGNWKGPSDGIAGPQGPQGAQGDQGPQGIQGPAGPQGPSGIGFVAVYDFNEGSGLASADTSGNNNNLTLTASHVAWGPGHTGNSADKALVFDGLADGDAQAPDSPSLDPTEEVQVSAWVNLADTNKTKSNTVVAKEGQYTLGIINQQVQFAVQTKYGPAWAYVGSGSVPTGTWTQVGASYDGQVIRTYVNGVMTSVTPYAHGPIKTGTGPLILGDRSYAGSTEYFAGSIDEVRVLGLAAAPPSTPTFQCITQTDGMTCPFGTDGHGVSCPAGYTVTGCGMQSCDTSSQWSLDGFESIMPDTNSNSCFCNAGYSGGNVICRAQCCRIVWQ